MTKQIHKVHGLTIEVEDGGGQLFGTLKETCPCCKEVDCTCEFFPSARSYDADKEKECIARGIRNEVMEGIESFLIALACEGVDIESPAVQCALETALDGVNDNS